MKHKHIKATGFHGCVYCTICGAHLDFGKWSYGPGEAEGVKSRRHHNNTGISQIKRGKTREQVAEMSRRILGH